MPLATSIERHRQARRNIGVTDEAFAALSATFPNATPSPWIIPTTSKRSNLFEPTDVLTFSLPQAGVAASYDVIDATGTIRSSGSVSATATTLTFSGTLPYGGYRLRLYGSAGTSCGATHFGVLCPAPLLPANPAKGTPGVPYDDAFTGVDNILRAVLDVSPLRWSYDPRNEAKGGANESLNATELAADIAHDAQWWGSVKDPARPRTILCELPNGSYDVVHMLDVGGDRNGPQVYLASVAVDPTTTWVSSDGSNIIVWTGTSSTALTQVESWPVSAPTADGEMRLLSTFSSNYIRAFSQHQGYQAPAVQPPTLMAETPGVNLHALITAMAAKCYPAGCTHFEGPWNEPPSSGNGLMGNPWGGGGNCHNAQEQEVCHAQMLFQEAVLAGAPNAVVCGPGTVSAGWPANATIADYVGGGKMVNNPMDTGLDIELAWLIAESRTDIYGAVTQHGYNNFNGDPWVAQQSWRLFNDILVNRGWGSRQRWMTEMGEFACVYGVLHERRQLSWGLRRTFLQEAFGGVTPECSAFYYPTSHGFWDYPSFWTDGDGTPHAFAFGRRAMSAAMAGKTLAGITALANAGWALHYTEGASSGAGDLLVLFTSGSSNLTAKVTSSAAGTIQDVFGNDTSQDLTAGTNLITISDLPTYVLVPKGTTIAVEDLNELMTATMVSGGTDTTSGNATNIAQVQKGHTNPYLWGGGSFGSPWSDSSASVPCTFGRAWTTAQKIDGVFFEALPPWQGCAVPLAFEIDALEADGVTWTPVYQYANTTCTSEAFVDGSSGTGCTRETYWNEEWQFDCKFSAPITTTAIRLVATSLSYGGEPDLAATQAGGQGGTPALLINSFNPYLSQGGAMPTTTTNQANMTDAQSSVVTITADDPSGAVETADPITSATFVLDSAGICTVTPNGLTATVKPIAGKTGVTNLTVTAFSAGNPSGVKMVAPITVTPQGILGGIVLTFVTS